MIYIRETLKLLKSSATLRADGQSSDDRIEAGHLRSRKVRKTMYELVAINVIIIAMDLLLLGIQFADLYLIQTSVKGTVYSIKLKLEYAVLSKLVQLVRDSSWSNSDPFRLSNLGTRLKPTPLVPHRLRTQITKNLAEVLKMWALVLPPTGQQRILDSIGSIRHDGDVTQADVAHREEGSDMRTSGDAEGSRRRARTSVTNWINEEIGKHNIK